jgi:hypothetical protein
MRFKETRRDVSLPALNRLPALHKSLPCRATRPWPTPERTTRLTMPHLVYSRSNEFRPSARKETTGAIDRPNKAESAETLRPIRNP